MIKTIFSTYCFTRYLSDERGYQRIRLFQRRQTPTGNNAHNDCIYDHVGIRDKIFGLGLTTPEGYGIIDGYSPTYDYLMSVDGWFAGLFHAMADYYQIADFLMMTGLLFVGITFLFGICSKLACLAGTAITLLFYMSVAPPIDNPILDYHLFYIVGIAAIYLGGRFKCLGLQDKWNDLPIVKRFSFLE